MPDFRVRFVGDLGNLSAFTSSIRNQTIATAQALEAQNARMLSRLSGTQINTRQNVGATLRTQGSAIVQNTEWIADAYGKSFTRATTFLRAYVKEWEVAREKITRGRYAGRERTFLRPVIAEEEVGRVTAPNIGNQAVYNARQASVSRVQKHLFDLRQQAADRAEKSYASYSTKILRAEDRAAAAVSRAEQASAARQGAQSAVKQVTKMVRDQDKAVDIANRAVDRQVRRITQINRAFDDAILGKGGIRERLAPDTGASFVSKYMTAATSIRGRGTARMPFVGTVGAGGEISRPPVGATPAQFAEWWRREMGGRPLPSMTEWRKAVGPRGQVPTADELLWASQSVGAEQIGYTPSTHPLMVRRQAAVANAENILDTRRGRRTSAVQMLTGRRGVLGWLAQTILPQRQADEIAATAEAEKALGTVAKLREKQAGVAQRIEDRLLKSATYRRLVGMEERALSYQNLAREMPAPLSPEIEQAFKSKGLRTALERQLGLGQYNRPTRMLLGRQTPSFGTDDYLRRVGDRELQVTGISKNLGENITRISGTMKDSTGVVTNWTAALDKNNKVIEGFGRRWGAMSGFLKQTVFDFRKVLEWTVATTVVIGAFGAVVGSIRSINELNADLQRFAITAKTSGDETTSMFKRIAKVAYDTATPIAELVKSADDVALATRKAGQSTQEWQSDIVKLTSAVGILTNLTGLDTVTATEKLTAIFKQLGASPEDLIGVLNKMTAVAGGNAESITDIATALSLMTEAASQAQMTLDQQISAVQVIAQATGKTADETATAFKNLFGAILNPIAIKTLGEFGIAVKDSAGNMRPFLEIYREVQSKIETGLIPKGRVQEVVRAMAGGPRRAPDAAALLSNIFKVYETVPTSVNATNEALIANSKILDTNAAKLQQVSTLWQTTVFLQANEVVQNLTQTFANLALQIAQIVNLIPSGFTQFAVSWGLIAGGALAFGKALRALLPDLTMASFGISKLRTEWALLQAAMVAGPTSAIPYYGKRALGSTAGKFAVGAGAAGLGLGVASAAGGFDQGQMGSALVGIGAMTTLIPHLAPLGLGIMAVGTVVSLFASDARKATDESKDLKIQIYEALQSYRQITQEIETQTEEADRLEQAIDKTKVGTEENKNAIKVWVEALGALNDKTREQRDLWKEIIELLPNAGKEYSTFMDWAVSGAFNEEQMKELQRQLNKDILTSQSQLVSAWGENGPTLTAQAGRQTAWLAGIPERQDLGVYEQVRSGQTGEVYWSPKWDTLSQMLQSDLGSIKQFFKDGEFKMDDLGFQPNAFNIATFRAALETARETETIDAATYAQYVDQFGVWVSKFGDIVANMSILIANREAYATTAKALGLMTDEEYQNYTARTEMVNRYLLPSISQESARNKINPRIARAEGIDQSTPYTNLANQILGGQGKVSMETAQKVFEGYTKGAINPETGTSMYDEIIKVSGTQGIIQGTISMMEDLKWVVNETTGEFELLDEESEDALIKLQENIKGAVESAKQSLGEIQLQGKVDLLTGDITQRQFDLLIEKTNKYRDAVNGVADALTPLTQKGLDELSGLLSKNILGFQGVEASADAIIGTFLNVGTVLNLTGDNLIKFMMKVALLAQIAARLAVLNEKIANASIRATISNESGSKNVHSPWFRLQGEKTDAMAEARAIADEIAALLDTGKPDTGKTSGASTPSPGKIDLPEEVTKRGPEFVKAFVAQAARDAAKIQSQIPGENKKYADTLVAVFNGFNRVMLKRGIAEEYWRDAIDRNTEQLKIANDTKADAINRIRIGNGSFAAIANVPMNTKSGVSVGGPQGPITISLNVNGQVLTPAQMDQIIDRIMVDLKSAMAGA